MRLMISPGDKVSEGQPVMELETDKAVIEVPSSVSGVVKEVRVKQGEKIKVGQVIFTLEGASAAPAERIKQAPVEHVSGQQGARLAFQAAIDAEGKTEEQALPPDPPQTDSRSFAMPAQLDKGCGQRASRSGSCGSARPAAGARTWYRNSRSEGNRTRRTHQRR